MTTPGPAAKSGVILWAIFVLVMLVVVIGVGAVFLGGSKTRALFGASADALAGPERVKPADAGSP